MSINANLKSRTENEYKLLSGAFNSIKRKIPYEPEVAMVLGTGLGDFVNSLKIDAEISFSDIKNFPRTTNASHKGKFVFADINGVKVVIVQGRIHYYEGYDVHEAVRTIRLAKMMGAKTLIVTNAAGGVNKKFKPGDIMLITDHISLFMRNPLIGQNVEEFGTRFPDMTDEYDKGLRKEIKDAAKKSKITLREGVYAQLTGPSYETAAEIQLLSKLSIDAVGMSTVIEVITARHAGMKVGGLSVITNMATGLTKELQSDDDVKKTAKKVSDKLHKIINNLVNEKAKFLK